MVELPEEDDGTWFQVHLAADHVRKKVPPEYANFEVTTFWVPRTATVYRRLKVILSGEAVKLAGYSRDAIAGILAHEIAHLYLQDHPPAQPYTSIKERERLVDQIACSWGLQEELCAFFREYEAVREKVGWRKERDRRAGAGGP